MVNLAAGRAGSAGWLAAQVRLAELVRLAASEAGSAGWLAAQVGLAPQLWPYVRTHRHGIKRTKGINGVTYCSCDWQVVAVCNKQ